VIPALRAAVRRHGLAAALTDAVPVLDTLARRLTAVSNRAADARHDELACPWCLHQAWLRRSPGAGPCPAGADGSAAGYAVHAAAQARLGNAAVEADLGREVGADLLAHLLRCSPEPAHLPGSRSYAAGARLVAFSARDALLRAQHRHGQPVAATSRLVQHGVWPDPGDPLDVAALAAGDAVERGEVVDAEDVTDDDLALPARWAEVVDLAAYDRPP